MTLAQNQSVMNRSFFSIAADAERIVGQPVHGGLDLTYGVQQPEREAHVVQKQILAEMLHAHKVKTGSIEHFAGLVDPACATLIDFRQDYPGLIGKPIVTMRCMPMYFAEVDPQDNWVIHHQDMATRLLIARQSGLLFMGCNEAMAVILGHESDESSQIVKAFMTDERGVPRPIHGVYPHDRRIIGSQRQIESLNVHEAESALNEAVRDAAVEAGLDPDRISPRRISLLTRTVELLSTYLPNAPQERKASGAVIKRSFKEGGKGSVANLTRSSDGWVHYPTSQDAWYFGVAVNFDKREVLNYAEGDVIQVICPDERSFRAELHEMAQFYGQSRVRCGSASSETGAIAHFYDSLFRLKGDQKVVSLRKQADDLSSVPLFAAVDLTHPVFTRISPDNELSVPADAFEVDLLDPLAFVQHGMRALQTSNGIAFILDIEGGDQRFGCIDR